MIDERRDLSSQEIVLLVVGVLGALASGSRVVYRWVDYGLDVPGWFLLGAGVAALAALILSANYLFARSGVVLERALRSRARGPLVVIYNAARLRPPILEASTRASAIDPGERLHLPLNDFLVRRDGRVEAVRTGQSCWVLEFAPEELVVWAGTRDPFALLRIPRDAIREVITERHTSWDANLVWRFTTDLGDVGFYPMVATRFGSYRTLRAPAVERAVERILRWRDGLPVAPA